MSHKGTLPVSSTRNAYENCLYGVERCDLFLSLITPQYGSGVAGKGEMSITHQELLKTIDLNKPRWILAHDHVVSVHVDRIEMWNAGRLPDGLKPADLRRNPPIVTGQPGHGPGAVPARADGAHRSRHAKDHPVLRGPGAGSTAMG